MKKDTPQSTPPFIVRPLSLDAVRIASVVMMVLPALFCALAYVYQEHDTFFGISLLLATLCLVWGLLLFILRKHLDLAFGCVAIGGLVLILLFVICAKVVA